MIGCTLTVSLKAICRNYRALDAMTGAHVKTSAVVKADAYGCGAAKVSQALYAEGARTFYVAYLQEAIDLRKALPPQAEILYFNGTDAREAAHHNVTPVINTPRQMEDVQAGQAIAVQMDSGMTRVGFDAFPQIPTDVTCTRVLSHLACADTPSHPQNAQQRETFVAQTKGLDIPRSLAATGGILLGEAYHFDESRPGIGLYGCAPYMMAEPVVTLTAPVLQTRFVQKGTPVGYGASWIAPRDTIVATLPLGYADGIVRSSGNQAFVWAQGKHLPVIGRVSMDLITVDVTSANLYEGDQVEIFGPHIAVDDWAEQAGTIGYEFLTALGTRYQREYIL